MRASAHLCATRSLDKPARLPQRSVCTAERMAQRSGCCAALRVALTSWRAFRSAQAARHSAQHSQEAAGRRGGGDVVAVRKRKRKRKRCKRKRQVAKDGERAKEREKDGS
jgi:hypothetical protein